MSASNEWWEYHLTPTGWIEGSEKLDFGEEKTKPVPADRVLTVRFKYYQSFSLASPECSIKVKWEHADKELIKKLKKQFGNAPEEFKNWREKGFGL